MDTKGEKTAVLVDLKKMVIFGKIFMMLPLPVNVVMNPVSLWNP
jgi:hypothetical protein